MDEMDMMDFIARVESIKSMLVHMSIAFSLHRRAMLA